MSERGALQARYGFAFPDDLHAVWELACNLSADQPLASMWDLLGFHLIGPFAVLAGKEPPTDRAVMDPPEMTVCALGLSDGERCGYWTDDPARGPAWVVSYFEADAYEVSPDGRTLLDAVRLRVEIAHRDTLAYIDDDPDEASSYRRDLDRITMLRERLLAFGTKDRSEIGAEYLDKHSGGTHAERQREITAPTLDGMGIVVPAATYRRPRLSGNELRAALGQRAGKTRVAREAAAALESGTPGTALELAKALWVVDRKGVGRVRAAGLLARSYRELGRPLLARTAEPVTP
jgi:hypothetical protein